MYIPVRLARGLVRGWGQGGRFGGGRERPKGDPRA